MPQNSFPLPHAFVVWDAITPGEFLSDRFWAALDNTLDGVLVHQEEGMSSKLKTNVLVYIHCFDPVIDLSMGSDRDSHVHDFVVGRKFNKLEKY